MAPVDPTLKDWLEVMAYVATVIGIPIAIIVFRGELRRDRRLRSEQIYLGPHDHYIDYLRLCFDHPDLDIYDLVTPTQQTPENTKREWIAFNILVSIMEHAFLVYRAHPDPKNKQWAGWEDYIRWWMARPNFRRAWDEGLSSQFDDDFIDFVKKLAPYEPVPGELSSDWMTRHQQPSSKHTNSSD